MNKRRHLSEGIFSKMAEGDSSSDATVKELKKQGAGRPRSVLIPDDLYAKAEEYKWKNRISLNEVIRQALERFLASE
jgi:hypothetical protein